MVNGVSWTLSYEIFFYFLFSFAFVIPDKRISFFLSLAYMIVIIALPFLGHNMESAGNWENLVTAPVILEFFMGVIAAVIIIRLPEKFGSTLVILGCITFLAGAVSTDLNYHLLPGSFNRVVVFGIPAFLIITGLVKLELSRNIIVHNILLSLGEASYSLYLIHLPLVVAGIRIISRSNIENIFTLHMLLLLLTGIICFVSLNFYKWIERPIITKLNSLW
jgi:exopolysaccharide production protein ExoZ